MLKRLRRYKRKYVIVQRAQRMKIKRAQRIHVKRLRTIRQHPFLIPVIFLVIAFAGFLAFVVSPKGQNFTVTDSRIVIISHDGYQETVPTREPTVGALLSKLKITINPGDIVQPSVITKITQDDFRINVYRGRPIEIVDGVQHSFSYSAGSTPRAIVQQAGTTLYPEDNVSVIPTQNFLQDQAIGERVVIDRATPINFNIYGTQTVIRTHATTVGELLKEKSVVLGKNDSVVPSVSTPLSSTSSVYLIHSGTQISTEQQTIPMPMQVIEDSSLAYGTSAVVQQGSNGEEVLTYQLNLQNGQVASKTLLQTVVTQQPVTEIVDQGTSLSGIKGDMALAGISATDYQYADYIISHESGWCPTKAQGEHTCPVVPDNSGTSGGYGLCQATPGYKMSSAGADWATNPVTQLEWCNGYANSRYGGWYPAYQHWVADGNW